ncbi:hypothetical protein wVul_0808 [Wolbachia endosymbiont of Armadillidium vulgare str. wVulC]|uniref:hypothetical protein n=1 Tax=Wolbachia endosymbiont of Armadillidium vulgare TaxID=77039 RepID=UPI0006D4C605|nr:hypothetical protein [Wolbachia endosymbiont of Armadillidium vulgare]KLT22443.1 hypothetical protein wVul_0808 [Wolbachia endosymbiont of Armadillidium vulgare str. wVulC]
MPGTVDEHQAKSISCTPESENDRIKQAPPKPARRKISSTAGNNGLLILDFNQTIVDGFMCNSFASKGYSDYNSGKENPVTKEKIEEFLQDSEIKNKEKLKSVLESALSNGVEIAIVSHKYPKAVEYIVKNHLDLEEQAQAIKVFEGIIKDQTSQEKQYQRLEEQCQRLKALEETTKDQTSQTGNSAAITDQMIKRKDPQSGKHLCFLYLLKAYKKDKDMLPQKVMLVDGNMQSTNPADNFRKNIEELLEKDKDMKSFLENIDQEIAKVDISKGELENITFKGINVFNEAKDYYLNEAEKWITSKNPHHAELTSNGTVRGESEYAVVDLSNKTSKKSPNNEIDNPTLSRLSSEKTIYSEHLYNEPEDLKESSSKSSDNQDTPPTPPPSYKTDGSEKSLSTNSEFKLQKNRSWPRAKYAMQQKGFVIFSATAIVLGTSAALVHLQDKAKFIAFFANSPLYTIIPVIAIASLLAISPMFLGIKQFVNTKEYQAQGKNADEVLDNVLKCQRKDKAIKSVRLKYSNGTHSNFVLNAWESKNDFINIDEKVISKTNKIESLINNRPIFTTLLTGVVAANVALPLGLLATNGVNGVQKFYQNPLTNDIGLSLLIGSGVLALLILCLGVHYYRKTNCTNLIYSQEKIGAEGVNEKFTQEIKQERTKVLEENHSKDAKRSSLTLEQVIVQSHNYPDVIYGW